jgi:biotin carboxyl carrier protein
MKIQFDHNSQTYSLDLALSRKTATITIDGKPYTVEIVRAEDGIINLRFSDSSVVSSVVSSVSSDGAKRWVTVNGQTWMLTKSSGGRKGSGHGAHAAGELVSPMPGQVRAVQVAEGESVTKGQTLIIVEAMKMEIKIAAPKEGKVKSLKVRQGQTVDREQTLAEIE